MRQRKSNFSATKGLRTCFVCKQASDKKDLLRFVGRPGQVLTFDKKRTLPGRGMWVHVTGDCLQQAVEKRLFYKAAKGTVKIPDGFLASVQAQLSKNINSDCKEGSYE